MLIRPETPADFPAIYDFVKTAFATADRCDGDEQDYVNKLRASDRYLPQLALVAEENGILIGHIMLTTMSIIDGNTTYTQLLLSPLCVALSHRKTGVGSQLVAESFRLARPMGYQAVFLVGNPAYYSRFGFRPVADFGIVNDSTIPDPYVMGCELVPNGLQGQQGSIQIV